MGLITNLKLQKAARAHGSGNVQEAKLLYAEAFQEGAVGARYVLSYAVLLLKSGDYQQAKDFLVKHQKEPGITDEQKSDLFMYYAIACYKLGDLDRGIHYLELQHQKCPTGNIYQTLGYLYVEKYAGLSGEEYQEGIDKALAFNQAAVEYDDEDSVCLDNMGQFYYRVLQDKEQARPWFEKAIAIKDDQIDTLWFLSRYDLDEGKTQDALEKLESLLQGNFSVLNHVQKEQVEAEIARLKEEANV